MAEAAAAGVSPRGGGAGSLSEEPPSGLEREGPVRWDGRLTHFVARDFEQQMRRSAPLGSGCLIPAVDPAALQDLAALAVQAASQVDELLRSVHGALQALTALSVGCIQTYRDGVESLGEAVDTSIRSMYTLMARCEELDKAMQPVPALARRIRDMKGALEKLEGLCK
uniref:BLOC-1-related complex subunit 6-like n=1 Tax=Podarcis muralis TaxID=64176 RepID=UPI00109F6F8D|nr:BLOC-1-related complex subunit 6-like [Podarcis muralis]